MTTIRLATFDFGNDPLDNQDESVLVTNHDRLLLLVKANCLWLN